MSAPIKTDWSEVRCVVVAAGYRAASEAFGIKEATIRQRACREGWFRHPVIKAAMAKRESVSRAVTADGKPSAAVAIAGELLALNQQTRIGLARGLAAAGERVGELDGDEVIALAEKIMHIVRGAGTIHGWRDAEAVSMAAVILPTQEAISETLRRLSVPRPALTVEAEAVEITASGN